MKSKVEVVEVSKEGKLLKKLNNKQIMVFAVPLIIGIAMLFGKWSLKIFGLIFIAFTLFVFLKFKDRIVVEVYNDFIIYYHENKLISKIYWEDIKSWDLKISQSTEDSLVVTLKDDNFVNIMMFGIGRLAVYFRKFVFKKNAHEQYKDRENSKGNSLLNIFKR